MNQIAKNSRSTIGRTKNTGPKNPTKKIRLIALLSRKRGCGLDALMKKLDWQAHTVRAAIARLRAEGMEIITIRSKAGLTGYRICECLDRVGADK